MTFTLQKKLPTIRRTLYRIMQGRGFVPLPFFAVDKTGDSPRVLHKTEGQSPVLLTINYAAGWL